MDQNYNFPEAKIRLLDINTSNQIAAGEVVERPASVIKELVENAIDAGANHISVKILADNAEKIQVSDNGLGMVPDDLLRSVQRHATSKIRRVDDLKNLHTLGFRGEALPSIASVSKMTISSRVPGALSGYIIEVENSKPTTPRETGIPEGTTVLIEDLFYNTPARKKFLKSTSWELGQISDCISHLALSKPGIAFSLEYKKKKIINTSGNGDISQAFLSVYGKDMLKSMVNLEWMQNILIYGMVSLPELSRSNRQYYNFFINNRWVRSQELSKAVDEAYHTLLPQHRYPITALYLSLAPDMIDVNVHPAKMEVKFRDPQTVKDCLIQGIKQALLHKERMSPRIGQLHGNRRDSSGSAIRIDEKGQKHEWELPKADITIHEHTADQSLEQSIYRNKKENNHNRMVVDHQKIDFHSTNKLYNEFTRTLSPESETNNANCRAENENSSTFSYKSLKLLGQINASYIAATGEDGVYFIDQHAAHERILYEKLKNQAEAMPIDTNMLAIPETLELTYQERLHLLENIIILTDLGFIIEHFGDNTFILRGVPFYYQGTDNKALIMDILAQIAETGKDHLLKNREEELFMMACKSAIKANRYLTDQDIMDIFQKLDLCENSSTCPHGRPISIKLSFNEITRKFLRTNCI